MIEIETLSKRFIDPLKIGKNGYAWMFDDKKTILSHPRRDFIGMTVLDVIKKMHKERGELFDKSRVKEHIREEHNYLNRIETEKEGLGIYINCLTDEKDLIAFYRISVEKTTWNLMLSMPYSEISGPIQVNARNMIGLAGLLILFLSAGGLTLFRTQKRAAKLEIKSQYLQEIAKGAEALRESEQKLSGIVNAVTDHMCMMDRQFNIIWTSENTKSVFGKDIVGRKCFTVFQGRNELCKQCIVKKCFKDGGIHEFETEITIDGKQMSFRCTANVAARDEDGRPKMAVEFLNDITAHKQAQKEKEALQIQLQQAQKMEAVGTLAGGIAHDFNNILTAIIGFADLAKNDVRKGSLINEYLEHIFTASYRAKGLVKQILAFSYQTKQEYVPIQVHFIVKEALNFLRASIPSTIEIRQNINPKCGIVLGDPTQLNQIIMNLCTNAYHAMRDQGGVLEVNLELIEVDAGLASKDANLHKGTYVRLTVGDTGCGMDQATMKRIFEPYFTTKDVGDGTGIGLSVVHGIIISFGGAVLVNSTEGEGSTFQVFFPSYTESNITREAPLTTPIPKGTEHILFVDDEAPLVELGRITLEKLGYKITARTSSIEALEVFRTQPHEFDLVITDNMMPNMTGIKLAGEMMRIRPNIPVILITGFSETIAPENLKEMGIKELVMKPILAHGIAEIIRKVLDYKELQPESTWKTQSKK